MILKFLSFSLFQKAHKYTEFRLNMKVNEVIKLSRFSTKNPQKFEDFKYEFLFIFC